jgi:protein-S-isoprenylcysteine O-methyltransferase Ste14
MFPFGKAIILCWIVFWLYWFIAAFNSKKSTTSTYMRFMKIRIAFIVLAFILFRYLNVQNYSFQNRLVTSNELVQTVGFVIFLSGLLLAIWARLYLGKNWGMPMSQKQNPELVTSGPYHYIRHPIYSGILLAMLGSSLAGSLFWLTVFAITGIYFIYCALMEEKIMTEQFPKVYPTYKAKSKMLIPFIL